MASNAAVTKGSQLAGHRVLSAKYLQDAERKHDLVQRMRTVLQTLRSNEDIIDPDASQYRQMPSLCKSLMDILDHKDKLVRLYASCSCMELFAIYAPDAPWDIPETIEIFRQTIRQLGNLSHTTSRSNEHYSEYKRILQLLAEVKIAVVLVDLTKDEQWKEEALSVLSDLFHILLQSIRPEHPASVAEMMQSIICGCLEEYHDSLLLPIPLLDEVLICIGQGPKSLVIDPAKAAARAEGQRKNKLTEFLVEQTNPSFIVASSIIRNSVERLSTPIASLLNGLLNNDQRLISESKISTKLTKEIAKPQTQDQQTQADIFNIIFELHRISPSILTTVIGTITNFLVVPDVEQRKLIVHLLGKLFVKSPSSFADQYKSCFRQWLERSKDKDDKIRMSMANFLLQLIPAEPTQISAAAQQELLNTLKDPVVEVRLTAIHGICDRMFQQPDLILLETWTAAGHRVHSKHKQERKDTMTGLVQTYFKQYVSKLVAAITEAGDNASLDLVQGALDQPDDIRFGWIPSRVIETAGLKGDSELRSRLWQVIDTLLLGSELPNSSKKLNATSRAVALARIMDDMEDNAFLWLGELLKERAKLQSTVLEYLELRAGAKNLKKEDDPEAELTQHAMAMQKLELLWTEIEGTPTAEAHRVLNTLHTSKNKRFVRILEKTSNSCQTLEDRVRMLEDLSKCNSPSDKSVVLFLKKLVRRCSMGDFINCDVIHHCSLLAQECAMDGDNENCMKFMKCISVAVNNFPKLGAFTPTVENFVELLDVAARNPLTTMPVVLTSLVGILARSARWYVADSVSAMEEFSANLEKLCVEGTPEQAKDAMATLLCLQNDANVDPIVQPKALLSRLSKSLSTSLIANRRAQCILGALSELMKRVPGAMHSSSKGPQLIQRVFDRILVTGRASTEDEGDPESDEEVSGASSPTKSKRRRSSLSCKTQCAAIHFVVVYIRSAIFFAKETDMSSLPSDLSSKIAHALDVLFHTFGDTGPKSLVAHYKDKESRKELRECALLHILKLCDARLGLEAQVLTSQRWVQLSNALVNEESAVRERLMEELGLLLTGNGDYGSESGVGKAMIPSFKLASLVALCADGDSGKGGRGSVGKRSITTKMNASAFVLHLRKIFEVESARSRDGDLNHQMEFERRMKVRLMPEYIVPYTYYLLSIREETPTSINASAEQDSSSEAHASHKLLRKRLKWLFDPIVLTAGEDCGNVSFLLSMTEKLAKFAPVFDQADNSSSFGRLMSVCTEARKVLLSYVKRDVNLTAFPGQIHIPKSLFCRMRTAKDEFVLHEPISSQLRGSATKADQESRVHTQTLPDSSSQPVSQETTLGSSAPLTDQLSPLSGEITRGSETPLKSSGSFLSRSRSPPLRGIDGKENRQATTQQQSSNAFQRTSKRKKRASEETDFGKENSNRRSARIARLSE